MATFTDTAKRDWVIQLDAPTILSVRESCDERFMLGDESEEDNTCTRLGDDQVLLCLVIYVLCERQCSERKIDRDTFLREVIASGDTIEAAREALVAAIVNFTPPRKRKWVEALIKKQQTVEDLAITQGLAAMDDPALMPRLQKAISGSMSAAVEKALTRLEKPSSSADSSESDPKE